MKTKVIVIVALAVLATLMLAGTAYAGTTEDIIKDAADGTIDGNYTAAQIRAALAAVQNNPTYLQYSDVEPILEDYLASLPSPGVQGGGLKFTGGELMLLFGAGFGLMGSGLALRRRRG
jgi:hypothetical protein